MVIKNQMRANAVSLVTIVERTEREYTSCASRSESLESLRCGLSKRRVPALDIPLPRVDPVETCTPAPFGQRTLRFMGGKPLCGFPGYCYQRLLTNLANSDPVIDTVGTTSRI